MKKSDRCNSKIFKFFNVPLSIKYNKNECKAGKGLDGTIPTELSSLRNISKFYFISKTNQNLTNDFS